MIFAQLSDFTGRKTTVLGAFVVFIAFSIGCGFAQSLDQLIAFRTLQGIGGSGLYALTIIVSLEISMPKTWPLVSGLVGGIIAIAGVLGPILGGVLTEYTVWRWIFWIKYDHPSVDYNHSGNPDTVQRPHQRRRNDPLHTRLAKELPTRRDNPEEVHTV